MAGVSHDEPFDIPAGPVTFIWTVSLAMTGRLPWKAIADQLQPGDPVYLVREPGNRHDPRAIQVCNREGQPAGYLYAAEAGLLYLLFDHDPPLQDRSFVDSIIGPGHSRRSPIIRVRLQLDLASPATLFALIAILALKEESFPRRFSFQLNPWLAPLLPLHQSYRQAPDQFALPGAIVEQWRRITAQEPDGSGGPHGRSD